MKYLLTIFLLAVNASSYAVLAGGRPNAFSEGLNAFAGVVNPANAVWIDNRLDVGAFWVNQKFVLDNKDDNPLFPPGKTDFTHRVRNIFTADAAFHKHFDLNLCSHKYDSSFTLAIYTMPSLIKLRTKDPIPSAGTTHLYISNRTDVVSGVFSLKLNPHHSIGVSIDYFYFSHRRDGFQNSDNPQRSVSPGNVTNNGTDHSCGVGFGIGWRWKISEKLDFGTAWTRKNYCGQYRRYRGYEPHHAENFTPQTVGAGFRYKFSQKMAGRLEVLWVNQGNLPAANNNVLPDGRLNLNKRGSHKSPGPGLNDATYINMGMGYQINKSFAIGAGYSHRIKVNRKNPNIISHTYRLQTTYDILSLGAYYRCNQHDLFFSCSYGLRNRISGNLPIELGGGRLTGTKDLASLSVSWGYMY
jgi:long-subunit fatty acid transport protein